MMNGIFSDTDWRGGKIMYIEGDTVVDACNYSYSRNNAREKDWTIGFGIDDFPGQCGAVILHDFTVENRLTKNSLYELGIAFAKDVKKMNWESGAKLVASAVVGSDLYHLLNNEYWQRGTARRNSNSSNDIVIFELDLRSR